MSTEAERRAKREWKKRNPGHEKLWTRTLIGRISRMYTNIQCRCRTYMQGSPNHYGLAFISREQFEDFAQASPEYAQLWAIWSASGFRRDLVPTIDRINPKEGYIFGNIEFVTQGENSRRNNVITWRNRRG